LLKGSRVFKDCLVEFSCPIHQWVEKLMAQGKRMTAIKPLLLPPRTQREQPILVVSDHGLNGLRHTAYIDNQPVFTRLTSPGFSVDEVVATISYLKNQFHIQQLSIECYVKPDDFDQLLPIANENLEMQLIPLGDNGVADELVLTSVPCPYSFVLPRVAREANIRHNSRMVHLVGATAAAVLLCAGVWQYIKYAASLTIQENTQAQLTSWEEKVNLVKANLPMEKLLPEPYKERLNEVSPITLFRRIGQALTNDITVSSLKWENRPDEERLLLAVKIVHQEDEADQNMDAIDDFRGSLQDLLPTYEVMTQSLPHGTATQETFSGSTSAQDLTLAGDRLTARIQLIRKKNS
jgi:hypothetical protein